MAEYIEREAAIAVIEEKQKELCPVGMYSRHAVYGSDREKFDAWEEIIEAIEAIPAADVRPVVRAHWYWDKDGMDWGIGAWRCSACKTMSPMWWNCDKGSPMHKSGHKFCPNCGAEMEES